LSVWRVGIRCPGSGRRIMGNSWKSSWLWSDLPLIGALTYHSIELGVFREHLHGRAFFLFVRLQHSVVFLRHFQEHRG
jgi:hypothetical protein